jgi:hypothetical protein
MEDPTQLVDYSGDLLLEDDIFIHLTIFSKPEQVAKGVFSHGGQVDPKVGAFNKPTDQDPSNSFIDKSPGFWSGLEPLPCLDFLILIFRRSGIPFLHRHICKGMTSLLV